MKRQTFCRITSAFLFIVFAFGSITSVYAKMVTAKTEKHSISFVKMGLDVFIVDAVLPIVESNKIGFHNFVYAEYKASVKEIVPVANAPPATL
jgi:hypothetical protein